ncbi:bifunctional proline dehydrogenase/L-glutamate gamma-semialdehyde dehydrogenase [uncultured Corynebacterium sp.]|uniref:bifunctional proline dehydrogenase/L-glutamate gamma-semialdehyde dehydrogenase n=1 Tax=uncultured Corynebacterium sp. TaxID=159447 RepID=UPI0025EA9192|nr:bifunctional proline dehydrogenase/L-glutamate gamma-semialdehyde dehydrogenase [uncultured Corynebacterium sp.]
MASTHDDRHHIDDDARNDGAADASLVPLEDLVEKAVERAMGWLEEAERINGRTGSSGVAATNPRGDGPDAGSDDADGDAPEKDSSDHAAEQLAKLVHDPAGVDYTMAFVDQVARPEDNKTAAKQLASMTKGTKAPEFLSTMDRAAMQLGGIMAPKFPWLVMPIARKRMRQLVGHLVLDSDGKALTELLSDARDRDRQLNLNLLGEAVLGSKEAESRLHDTMALLRDPLVDYVSVKASSIVSQLNPWDFDGSVERLVQTLRPLYRIAVDAPGQSGRENPPFINMDMEEYHDLDLTLEVFERLMSEDEFLGLEAGIVLQAYLPDSVAAVDRLIDFAKKRVARGGAPVKVRLVKGANLSMETVDADLHGWVRAPYSSKAETDANYLRLLDRALRPDVADALRVGVASHNLFSMAAAVELARARGVERQIDAEMLQGMAPMQQKVIQDDVGRLILYTPVVDADSFDVAVSYLVRRLEENAAEENFIYAMTSVDEAERAGGDGPDPQSPQSPMSGQEERFRQAVAERDATRSDPRRTQDRRVEGPPMAPDAEPGTTTTPRAEQARTAATTTAFHNEPDTDPALPANREWAAAIVDPSQDPGPATSPIIDDVSEVDSIVDRAIRVQSAWADLGENGRASVLETVGDRFATRRGALLAAMVHGPGKTIAESDPEVSEAIDFIRYYAASARALADEPGISFEPNRVTVISPPWNFPVAIPVGGMVAALAAGSAVIISPAPQVVRVAEIAVAALRQGLADAGASPDLIQLANTDEGDAGRALLTHDDVDAVVLTGASETAALFRGWRPERTVLAETSGKNAIIVTPAADPDLAAADVISSAFGHAGQKCSAGSLVILVGAAGKSERLLGQILDAAETLHVGHGRDLSTDMGPLVEPPGDKLHRGLTALEPGEKWLVKPRQLDDEGLIWSPGIRDNVKPGSWFHLTECFGPVLGVMRAPDLETAIEWQNAVEYGLTGGIHTLDSDEVATWLSKVEVGNAYVNRHITGAIVRRQSFGGWKGSSVGPGAKAGGPNYVAQLGTVVDAPSSNMPRTSTNRAANAVLRDLADALRASAIGATDVSGTGSGDAPLPTPESDAATDSTGHAGSKTTAADLGSDIDTAIEYLQIAGGSDAHWTATEFGVARDESGLVGEANVFRYRAYPKPVVRVGPGAHPVALARTVLAAAAARSAAGRLSESGGRAEDLVVTIAPSVIGDAENASRPGASPSRADSPVAAVLRVLSAHGLAKVVIEDDDDFASRVSAEPSQRVRCLGAVPASALEAAAENGSWLDRSPVVQSGRHEMLHFLREQAVSWSLHRFGHVSETAEEHMREAFRV